MNARSGVSIVDMCRTCMIQFSKTKNNTEKKQRIHEVPIGCKIKKSIIELLQWIQPQISVENKDNLPTFICSDCIRKLLVSHEFIETYRNADQKFRKMLTETVVDKKRCNKLEDSQENIHRERHTRELLEKEENVFEITQFELEIEQIKVDGFEKQKEDEWLIVQVSEKTEDKEHAFLNPYRDARDNEWIQHTNCEADSSNTSSVIQKRKSDYIDCKILRKNASTRGKSEREERTIPKKNNDGSILCPQCESVFYEVKLWKEHMHQHRFEKNSKRKCTKSNKSMKAQSNQKDYKCEDCGKGFTRISYYKTHMRVHTGEEPYLCIECGKSFKNVSSLNTHMLRHKGEKTIQCPHCPKKFVCSSGLYGHMMVHTKEKPYVCDICGSAFHMAYQLRKHNLYHNGIKNYQCEYCDMKFVTREKQRRHMRTHTGEKPYRCKYCDRAFAQSNDCVKHLRQHLGDNVYQCELCPLRFPLARDLRAHFATHKDDDEETRARNLEARFEEERNLQIKLCCKED